MQTRRNTVFSAVPPAILEDSLRPIAKEARAGLLEFRILNEGPNRFTIDTSQFSLIFHSRWSLKTKNLWVAFKKLLSLLPPPSLIVFTWLIRTNHRWSFSGNFLEPAICLRSMKKLGWHFSQQRIFASFSYKIVRNGEHYFYAKYRICSDYELNDFFYIWEEAATGRCYLYFEGKERKLVIINLSLIFFLVVNFLIDIIYYSIGLAFLLNKIIWTVRFIKWTAAIVKGVVYLNLI